MKLVKGSSHVFLNLRRNEIVDIKYTIECPLRGYYLLGPIIMRKRDFFNIFCEKKLIWNRSYLTVYPRAEEVRELPIESRYRKFHPGMLTLRQLGYGTEFHSIRDYIKTDPFKKINWRATAKYNKLMVNQYELEDVFTDAFCGYIEDLQLRNYFISIKIGMGLLAVMEEIENHTQIKHQGNYFHYGNTVLNL